MSDLSSIADFLFEVGILSKSPRSWPYFLGSGDQSIADHLNRVSFVGFILAKMIPEANESLVIKMCLFHDIAEARTSDLNYVHQKYTQANENKALTDLASSMPYGGEIKSLVEQRNAGETLEAKIAKDADQLEFILSLKEQIDVGNERAKSWIPSAVKRLKLAQSQKLAETILKTDSDHWWFGNKDDEWWVSRNKE